MVQNKLEEHDVLQRADELNVPSSVIEFLQGHLGQPYGGFPEPLRTKVISMLTVETYMSKHTSPIFQ